MSKAHYHEIDTEGHADLSIKPHTYQVSNRRRAILLKCAGALCLLFLVFLVGGRRWIAVRESKYAYTYCGTTGAEARARGCHYAPMGRTWVPPECFYLEDDADPTVLEKDWYLDVNLTVPADPELVASGELDFGYTQHYHEEHCLYVMRQLAVAVALKKPMVPSIVGKLHHINHCSKSIVDIIYKAYDEAERPFFNEDVTESILEFEICIPMSTITLSHHEGQGH